MGGKQAVERIPVAGEAGKGDHLELKAAIAAVPTPGAVIPPELRQQVLGRLSEFAKALPSSDERLGQLAQSFPRFSRVWESASPALDRKLSDLFSPLTRMELAAATTAVSAFLRGHLGLVLLVPDTAVGAAQAAEILAKEGDPLEARLKPLLERLFRDLVHAGPPSAPEVDLLVTASELQPIPPEKIVTLKLLIKETDRGWTRIENQQGQVRDKLVPA